MIDTLNFGQKRYRSLAHPHNSSQVASRYVGRQKKISESVAPTRQEMIPFRFRPETPDWSSKMYSRAWKQRKEKQFSGIDSERGELSREDANFFVLLTTRNYGEWRPVSTIPSHFEDSRDICWDPKPKRVQSHSPSRVSSYHLSWLGQCAL
jgi:hypothetical protein